MSIEAFMAFVLSIIIVIALSRFISYLAGRLFTSQRGLRFFITPGVAVHEYSHAIACLLTGAKITEINLFAPEGGYVKHGQPKLKVVGHAAISLAPIFGCTLVLWLISWLFVYFDLLYIPMSLFNLGSDPGAALTTVFMGLYYLFEKNIASWSALTIVLLIIYLYLVFSIASALAPSSQDFKNSIIFIIFLVLLALVLIFTKPLSYLPVDSGSGTPFLDVAVNVIGGIASLALGLEALALIVMLLIYLPVHFKR